MKYRQIKNPIIPSSRVNPTMTTPLLRKADKDIRARYSRIKAQVLAMFERIPYYALNVDGVYSFRPEDSERLRLELGYVLDSELANGDQNTNWYAQYDKEAAAQGAAQTVANLSAMSEVYATARPLGVVLSSPDYQTRVQFALAKSYTHWKGLSASTQADLAQVIMLGIERGMNPKALKGIIADRLNVSRSKAAQYSQTDLTDTLRQARWAESEAAEEQLGLDIRMLWTSALIPTTRPWHASRHGRIYSIQEVKDFYASGKEKYNCRCSTVEVLMIDGKAQLTSKLQMQMTDERKNWTKDQ